MRATKSAARAAAHLALASSAVSVLAFLGRCGPISDGAKPASPATSLRERQFGAMGSLERKLMIGDGKMGRFLGSFFRRSRALKAEFHPVGPGFDSCSSRWNILAIRLAPR